jgi:hypothetical protein
MSIPFLALSIDYQPCFPCKNSYPCDKMIENVTLIQERCIEHETSIAEIKR